MQCTDDKIYIFISAYYVIGGRRAGRGCGKRVIELWSADSTDGGKDGNAGRKRAPDLKFSEHLLLWRIRRARSRCICGGTATSAVAVRGHRENADRAEADNRSLAQDLQEAAVFEIREILELAMRLEKNGEATYRKAMASCSDESMSALLRWMADEEASHREWFAALKSDLDQGLKNPFMEEMSRQVFKDLVGGQSFSLKEVDFSKVSSTSELISIFIEFEKDTVLFYELIAPFIEDAATLGHLQRIIAEEGRHIDRLREFKEARVAVR